MPPTHRTLADRRGKYAETAVCWWFRLSGYRIVARRWRAMTGEIDLIVRRRRLLVFVEVKYRFDASQNAIPSPAQRRRITATAALFLAKYQQFSDHSCRFDLVTVNHGNFFGIGRITHLKNAWQETA